MTFAVGVFAGALALLASSGLLFAAVLRLESVTAVLLAAYAIAWGELTVVAIALSVPRDLTRATCLAGLAVCAMLGRVPVRSYGVYGLIGAFTWYATWRSGVHATIAGVALGLLTPARPLPGHE